MRPKTPPRAPVRDLDVCVVRDRLERRRDTGQPRGRDLPPRRDALGGIACAERAAGLVEEERERVEDRRARRPGAERDCREGAPGPGAEPGLLVRPATPGGGGRFAVTG